MPSGWFLDDSFWFTPSGSCLLNGSFSMKSSRSSRRHHLEVIIQKASSRGHYSTGNIQLPSFIRHHPEKHHPEGIAHKTLTSMHHPERNHPEGIANKTLSGRHDIERHHPENIKQKASSNCKKCPCQMCENSYQSCCRPVVIPTANPTIAISAIRPLQTEKTQRLYQ